MRNYDLHYSLHGLIILMVGLLGGFGFARAIKSQNGKETAWRVVHSGGSVAGVLLIALGAIINRFSISEVALATTFWGVIISTYMLIAGMVIAAVTGQRGIGDTTRERGIRWKAVYYLYGVGAVGSVISFGALIVLCAQRIMNE